MSRISRKKATVRQREQVDDLQWLCDWVESQCDDEWEHGHALNIGMWDNPGWRVVVHLEGTDLENVAFTPVTKGQGGDDRWLCCRVEENVFKGDGDIRKLGRIVRVFRAWVQASEDAKRAGSSVAPGTAGRRRTARGPERRATRSRRTSRGQAKLRSS